MRLVLLPPEPNELENAKLTGCAIALCGTWHKLQSGSGASRLIVGGIIWRSIATRQATASTAAAALSRWPVMLLVELIGIVAVCGPKTSVRARASALSPTGVLVA